MINEYVLSKGLRNKLSLDALSEKYKVIRKQNLLEILMKGLADGIYGLIKKVFNYDVMLLLKYFRSNKTV